MRPTAFLKYLNDTITIDEPALNLILSQQTSKVTYRKDEVIYKKGRIPLQLSFMEKGNAIALSHSKPNRQVMRFWGKNQLICPIGFFNNMPSLQSIIALDDCEITKLSYGSILSFLDDFPEGYAIINGILKEEISQVEFNIRSLTQNKIPLQHEAFLQALSISFDE